MYRCFLKLCVLYPGVPLVPTMRLDHVWHAHVLDMGKYRADCEAVLGRFMGHYPYAGLRGEDDWRAWQADFAVTRRLFREHFGMDLGYESAAASPCLNHGDASDCYVGCVKPGEPDSRPRPDRDRLAD